MIVTHDMSYSYCWFERLIIVLVAAVYLLLSLLNEEIYFVCV